MGLARVRGLEQGEHPWRWPVVQPQSRSLQLQPHLVLLIRAQLLNPRFLGSNWQHPSPLSGPVFPSIPGEVFRFGARISPLFQKMNDLCSRNPKSMGRTFGTRPGIQKLQNTDKPWYIVDATDKILGRLASSIAIYIRGTNLATYTPSVDMGAFVIVVGRQLFTGPDHPHQAQKPIE